MTPTARLIQYILETTSWKHRYSYEKVAGEIEQRFLANTIIEVVEYLGGTTTIDDSGQLIVYTNVYPDGRPEDAETQDDPIKHS